MFEVSGLHIVFVKEKKTCELTHTKTHGVWETCHVNLFCELITTEDGRSKRSQDHSGERLQSAGDVSIHLFICKLWRAKVVMFCLQGATKS